MSSPARRLAVVVPLALAFIISFSCARGSENSPPQTSLKIGFLLDSLKIERWQTDLDHFQKRAKELGAEVQMENAESDDELQLQQAKKLLESGVSVLVVVPHDTDKAARIVAAAKAKHVPVISYDRLIHDGDVNLFIGFDAYVVGIMQADTLAQLAPKGNYVLLGGSPSDNNAKIVRTGQMYILKPFLDRGDIKIVADVWAKDWDPTEAYAEITNAISKTSGNITAIVASNDGTAGGAIQALQEHQLAGKVLVSGQDADLAGVIRVLDGTQTMTVYKPLVEEAKRAAEAAVSLAKHEEVKTSSAMKIGYKSVPAILLPPIVVKKNNVKETVIKDGFQNLETIQKSLPSDKWPK